MAKKKRTPIPQINKVRAELQREIGSKCPFCDSTDVGHFEIHHMDENPSNNTTGNLILLCPTCHSKITKGDIAPVEVLQKKIELIMANEKIEKQAKKDISFNGPVTNAITGENAKITINQNRKKKINKYSAIRADYIGHLIDRYNKYKKQEVKERINYALVHVRLKRKFKVPSSRSIYSLPETMFDELMIELQKMIDGTMLAKQLGIDHKNYSSLEEYVLKYR